MVFYLMKFKSTITTSLLILLSIPSHGQEIMTDAFEANGLQLVVESKELTKLVDNCGSILNRVCLKQGAKEVYKKTLCTTGFNEVLIRNKGYLIVVEHYSEPVGWSQFYVFDLCNRVLYLTKKLSESAGLEWEKFIEMDSNFKDKYISEIISL